MIIRNSEILRRLGEIHHAGPFMSDSPVEAVFLADPSRSLLCYHGDVAIATQNFMLAAYPLGFGACWIGVTNTEYEQAIRKLLAVPGNLVVLCAISIRYPDEQATGSKRSPVEMTHWGRYGATTD